MLSCCRDSKCLCSEDNLITLKLQSYTSSLLLCPSYTSHKQKQTHSHTTSCDCVIHQLLGRNGMAPARPSKLINQAGWRVGGGRTRQWLSLSDFTTYTANQNIYWWWVFPFRERFLFSLAWRPEGICTYICAFSLLSTGFYRKRNTCMRTAPLEHTRPCSYLSREIAVDIFSVFFMLSFLSLTRKKKLFYLALTFLGSMCWWRGKRIERVCICVHMLWISFKDFSSI